MTPPKPHPEPFAVVETRLVHDVHRRATTLLTDATAVPGASPDAWGELRDFVVAALHHHHRAEDNDLWPLLVELHPDLGEALAALTLDHEQLDIALEHLANRSLDGPNGETGEAASTVRDLVHRHLDREEPILFPAFASVLGDDDWAAFSQRTIASTPDSTKLLMVELLHQVSTDGAVDLLVAQLPPEARAALPATRAQARAVLDALAPDRPGAPSITAPSRTPAPRSPR
jgi:hemerythrin-like domain-containing protein